MCVCVFTTHTEATIPPNWVWQITKPFCSYRFYSSESQKGWLGRTWKTIPTSCHGAITGGFPAEPLPWEKVMVSLALLGVVCLDFCIKTLEFSQELWRRWADTQNSVFRVIRISSSYTGDEKLCFTLSQTCWLIPLFRDMDWLKCQLRIQGVFWSGLFWKIFFLPILGLWRDSKIPHFFLNAAEF